MDTDSCIDLVFQACEYVAAHSYACCDENTYQRFLIAELGVRLRARLGKNAPSVHAENDVALVFYTSNGDAVACPSPRTDIRISGSCDMPDLLLELKATSRVTAHQCLQANKYAHMMVAGARVGLVFLVHFLQPENETVFCGPVTRPLVVSSDDGASPPSGVVKKRRCGVGAAATTTTPDGGDTRAADTTATHFRTCVVAAARRRGPDAATSSVIRQVPIRHTVCMANDAPDAAGAALCVLVGAPTDATCETLLWSRYARVHVGGTPPTPPIDPPIDSPAENADDDAFAFWAYAAPPTDGRGR